MIHPVNLACNHSQSESQQKGIKKNGTAELLTICYINEQNQDERSYDK